MKKTLMAFGMVFVLAGFVAIGNAQAGVINGTVWFNASSPQVFTSNLNTVVPSAGSTMATFTVGQLNFIDPPGTTYGSFLSGGAGNPNGLAGLNSTVATTPIVTSTNPPMSGSLFKFTGSFLVTGSNPTVTHDDGFWMQIGAQTFDYSGPTPAETTDITGLTPGVVYSFTLYYAAVNGVPEVLQTTDLQAVPEPTTLLLLGLGLFGLGLLGIKRKTNA